MLITSIKLKEIEVTIDVICNRCEMSCADTLTGFLEYGTLSAFWGYGSKKDGDSCVAHLCEACVDDIVEMFKISPLIKNSEIEWYGRT